MSVVFLSHSSRDAGTAADMRARLEAQGHRSVFLSSDRRHGISAGRDWERELYRQLRACHVVIVVCSPAALESKWVFAEITHARSYGKTIIPAIISPCTLPDILDSHQAIDLTKDPEEAYERLWVGLDAAGLGDSFVYEGRPPYPGLSAFREEDAAVFFGRDDEIKDGLDLLRRLQRVAGSRFVAVLGISGTGKSSLLRAGLMPRLRHNPDEWLLVGPMRPGRQPVHRLSAAFEDAFEQYDLDAEGLERRIREAPDATGRVEVLTAAAEDLRRGTRRRSATVLLVVDQLEELLETDEELQKTAHNEDLLQLLVDAVSVPETCLMTLCTLRSDFLGAFQKRRAVSGLDYETIQLRPMPRDRFAHVIEDPAQRAGLTLGPGLTQAMVEDTETQDALPLLAFTLRELWERYGSDGVLTVEEYRDKLGGLTGSVARVADALVPAAPDDPAIQGRRLSPAEEAELRDAFLAMVRINEEGQFTRKPARWDDLPPGSHSWLEKLEEARLLISRGEGPERSVEVTHEALFRSWGRLQAWLDENLEFLLWRRRLSEAHSAWSVNEDEDALLRGSSLAGAERWRDERAQTLDPHEREFIDRSVAKRDRDRMEREKRRRRLLIATSSAAVMFLGVAGLAFFGFQRAEAATDLAVSRQLATSSSVALEQGQLDRAVLLAAEAQTRAATDEARAALNNALAATPYLGSILEGHDNQIGALAFSPDGRTLFSASEGEVWLWSTETGRALDSLPAPEMQRPGSLALSPDGSTLVAAARSGVLSWDLTTGSKRSAPAMCGTPWTAAFLAGGDSVVVVCRYDGAFIWDLGLDVRAVPRTQDWGTVGAAAFSAETQRLATSGPDAVLVWDLRTGQALSIPALEGDRRLVFDVGGQVLFSGGARSISRARLSPDLTDATITTSVTLPEAPSVVALHPDGEILATGHRRGEIGFWSVTDNGPVGPRLDGHSEAITALAFSPDGRRLASADLEGNALLWDVPFGRLYGVPIRYPTRMALDDDGSVVAVLDNLWGLHVWEPESNESRVLSPPAPAVEVVGASFTGDGDAIVVWQADGEVAAAEVASGERVAAGVTASAPTGASLVLTRTADTLVLHDWWTGRRSPVSGVDAAMLAPEGLPPHAFSPAGDLLALGTASSVLLWDRGEQRPSGTPLVVKTEWSGRPNDLAFSADGRVLAVGHSDGTIAVWDVESRTLRAQLGTAAYRGMDIRALRPSADGRTIATCDFDWQLKIWDVQSGEARDLGGDLCGPSARRIAMAFSPDGSTLAVAKDATLSLVDLPSNSGSTPRQLAGHRVHIYGLKFSPDGQTLISFTPLGISLWEVETALAVPHAGSAAWIATLAVEGKGTRLATGGQDGTVRLWDLEAKTALGPARAVHRARVSSLAFSEDGRRLASGAEDGSVVLHHEDGTIESILEAVHTTPVTGLRFDHGGAILVSGDAHGEARGWDLTNGTVLPFRFGQSGSPVGAVAFSTDDRVAASLSVDGTISLADVAAESDTKSLESDGYANAVGDLAFNASGDVLASGGRGPSVIPKDDGGRRPSVIFWDVSEREPLVVPLSGRDPEVVRVRFDAHGGLRVIGRESGALRVWTVEEPGSRIERACRLAGRTFEADEWRGYGVPGEPRSPCPRQR